MDVGEAFNLISHAIDAGRPAHGYLIVGDVENSGERLVGMILEKLFPDAAQQLRSKSHPDVVTLEPEGKARVISVDSMREKIVEPMSLAAFSGGWKVGVVKCVDRLNPQSANAFLKSLEEPTPMTMYLMLTDQPDSILPTIVSRSQRIDLPLSEGILEGEAYDAVSEAFAVKDAPRLAEILGELKSEAEDADVAAVRKAFYKTLMSFVRKLMHSSAIPAYLAYRNVEAVEEAYRRSERSMNDEAVLAGLVDRIVFMV